MKLIALYLLLIIGYSQLLEKYQIIGNPKPSLVSILTELQTQIKSGGAQTTTIAFLDNLKSTIDEEQIRHDQLYTQQRNQCSLELELRKKDIKDAEQVGSRANEQLENCSTSNNKARSELDNNLESQKTTDSDIKILKGIRDEAARLFSNKRRDHLDALTSLQQVLLTLDGFTGGDCSLAELGKVAMAFIQTAVIAKNDQPLVDISEIFAQVATENGGYREVYEKLKQLIVNFEQTLQKNLQDYQEVEDLQIQEYDDRNIHLVEYFNNLKRTEQQLRDHITAMSMCINQQTAIVDTARGKKVRNLQMLDSVDRMCKDFLSEYEKASQVRKDQIDLINQVKQSVYDFYSQKPQAACPGGGSE
ncbi:unnamed protein product [Paramecium octaurelia]|uniref:Uncharacterized protein n=1 Tax=Paramecium octaurelia TaxID=43137 RepID=A0A8S1VAT9_PAROT|nr:unnamed protein product [Paramecium octaurelia]